MKLDTLTAISPIDGRYRGKTEPLADYYSEFALIRYRVRVEIEYFITLVELLSKWAVPQFDYFHWQVKNGCGYGVRLDTDEWLSGRGRLSVIEKF